MRPRTLRSVLRLRSLLASALALSIGACTASDSMPGGRAAAPTTTVFRGYARYGDEAREFVPCDSTRAYWVVDSSQALWTPYRELAPDPGDTNGLFAVIEGRVAAPPTDGFGAGYAGTIVVDRPLYVAREGYGCAAPWSRFAYRAFGNEPFWSLTVFGDSLTLIRPGEAERVWRGTRDATPNALEVTAGDPSTGGIVLVLRPAPCRDTMAGSYFAYTATARVAGDSLAGCALKGDGD